jgi:hypothetical protein
MRPRGPCGQLTQTEAHLLQSKRKTDEIDAENLARLARLDPKLLFPLKHRGEASQTHMALIRSRQALGGVPKWRMALALARDSASDL